MKASVYGVFEVGNINPREQLEDSGALPDSFSLPLTVVSVRRIQSDVRSAEYPYFPRYRRRSRDVGGNNEQRSIVNRPIELEPFNRKKPVSQTSSVFGTKADTGDGTGVRIQRGHMNQAILTQCKNHPAPSARLHRRLDETSRHRFDL